MELVGYWTSYKEIQDIYHSVYLLRRSPGLPPCGSQQRREVIHDILPSLRSQLHQQVYPTTPKWTRAPIDKYQSRPRRRDSYKEALWEIRVALQRLLEAAKVLKSDIERLSHEPSPIAIVGVIVGVAYKVILWTDNQGPLVGLDKEGG